MRLFVSLCSCERESSKAVFKRRRRLAAGGETPSPSPPPQRQRVSPYNKDGMKGLTNSVNARSCSPERTQSPPDAAGIGKEKPKASDDDDGGGKDKFRGTSFFWHFDV